MNLLAMYTSSSSDELAGVFDDMSPVQSDKYSPSGDLRYVHFRSFDGIQVRYADLFHLNMQANAVIPYNIESKLVHLMQGTYKGDIRMFKANKLNNALQKFAL